MSAENRPLRALHFGAGNLGRGLVVPVLANEGVDVAVADVDPMLMDALESARQYPLEIISEDLQVITQQIPVAGAFHITHDHAQLERWLQEATIVTISVQFENLPKVGAVLHDTIKRRLLSGDELYILACENVAGSSTYLSEQMGLQNEVSADILHRTFLDTVVDRNSQAEWPKSLITRTEAYVEWTAQVTESVNFPVGTVHQVRDITPAFWRKRYFVNTVADSLAFLGYIRGYHYLHEAFQDEVLLDFLAPMFDELQRALNAEYGFDLDELWSYKEQAIRRLATPGIDRRIDTVARGAWRKLDVDERFVRPIPTLMSMGKTPTGLARAIAAVIWVSKDLDHSATLGPDVLKEVREMWASAPWSEDLLSLVFDQIQCLAKNMDQLKQ